MKPNYFISACAIAAIFVYGVGYGIYTKDNRADHPQVTTENQRIDKIRRWDDPEKAVTCYIAESNQNAKAMSCLPSAVVKDR